MKPSDSFEILFGRHGLTVEHVDSVGRFTFVFDTDPDGLPTTGSKKEMLVLNPVPLRNDKLWTPSSPDEEEHTAIMLDRVRGYLISHGWDVTLEKNA